MTHFPPPKNWLILRGFSRDSRHWNGFDVLFEQKLGSRARVLKLDNPGAGDQCRKTAPLTIPGYTEDIRARWLQARGRSGSPRKGDSAPANDDDDGSWGILGTSMGGMIALDWASRHPGDFARVVVISTSSGALSPPWDRARPWGAAGILRAFVAGDARARERAALGVVINHEHRFDAVLQNNAAAPVLQEGGAGAAARQLVALLAWRALGPISDAARRLLVVACPNDRLVSFRCSERIAAHYGARLISHPSAGHDVSSDDPHWTASAIAAWARGEEIPEPRDWNLNPPGGERK